MESIDKLRKTLKDCTKEAGIEPNKFDTYWITADACDHLIDEIEAEIERDYMRLPVDADGVPIHVGDVLDPPKGSEEYGRLMVTELTYDGEDWYFKGEIPASFTGQAGYFNVIGFTHAKPRTLEDVLRDVWEEALDYAKSDIWRNPDEVFAERADEIRELLGGDAE